jgi:hypothetical protein
MASQHHQPSAESLELSSATFPQAPIRQALCLLAKSSDRELRAPAYRAILHHGREIPSPTLELIAQEVSYLSIASALAHNSDLLNYSTRLQLAEKLAAIGRDDLVVTCLGNLNKQNATGLRILCDAVTRGRLLKDINIDLEPYYYAASFGDQNAEVSWFRKYGLENLKGSDLTATIDRIVSYAMYDRDPFARVTLAEMLLEGTLSTTDPRFARRQLSLAAMDGYLPAKLTMLKRFPDDPRSDLATALGEFLHGAYFPGIAWCQKKLSETDSVPRYIDQILKAYYWHPEYPLKTPEHRAFATSQVATLSDRDKQEIQNWALGKVLVADTDVD